MVPQSRPTVTAGCAITFRRTIFDASVDCPKDVSDGARGGCLAIPARTDDGGLDRSGEPV